MHRRGGGASQLFVDSQLMRVRVAGERQLLRVPAAGVRLLVFSAEGHYRPVIGGHGGRRDNGIETGSIILLLSPS